MLSASTNIKKFCENSTLLKLFGTLNSFKGHKTTVKNHISFLNNPQKIQNIKDLILQPFRVISHRHQCKHIPLYNLENLHPIWHQHNLCSAELLKNQV